MKFLVILDPPETLNLQSDTSLLLIEELLSREHEVSICGIDDIWLKGAKPMAETLPIEQFRRNQLPFFVLATQNPIEQEGTYPLPEAQLDRFMFNIVLDYPNYEEELQVVKTTTTDTTVSIQKIMDAREIIAFQHLIRRMPIADNVVEYAVKLVASTRPNTAKAATIVNEFVAWGAGPRASQALVLAAKGHAAINGKFSPDIEDVQAVALPILRHRIIRNFKAEAENISIEKIIQELS